MPEPLEPISHPSPLFRDLPDEDARTLARLGRERHYRAGQSIVEQGAVGDALYTILAGSVRIVMTSPEGREATLALLGTGDSFGELSLFDEAPRAADAIALTTTRVMVVSRDAFSGWLAARPRLAALLLRALSRRVRHTDRLLADFTFVDLPVRLARRLLDLCNAQGVDASGAARVTVTQAQLASMLGVSRESVNKELQDLAGEGLLQTWRGAVQIHDTDELRTFAHYGPSD